MIKNTIAIVMTLFFLCLTAKAQFHGIEVYKNIVSPQPANVGDTITAVIGVVNLDEFGDSVTISSIVDVVHHAVGDETSVNLISTPVLVFPGNFYEVTVNYTVLALDNTLTNQWTYPLAVLQDDAFVIGTLNRDGPNEVGVPQIFYEDYSNQTLVQQPPVFAPRFRSRVSRKPAPSRRFSSAE